MTALTTSMMDTAIAEANFDDNRREFLCPAAVAMLNGISLMGWKTRRNEIVYGETAVKSIDDILDRDNERVRNNDAVRYMRRHAYLMRATQSETKVAEGMVYQQYLSKVWAGGSAT